MTRHIFTPKAYHTAIGGHEAVLNLQPGDQVTTTTVDASGRDENGMVVTDRGNPMTGPFTIEGAEPGDVLVLHIERITPNRSSGWTSQLLAPNVVDPAFTPELFRFPSDQPRELAIWDLDMNANTATLRSPKTSLGSLTLPLDPMLGCFGVAPHGRQSISTATSGPHGGNMDYRGFRAGTMVYLPVAVPGAMLYLGDGHAVQGDGEIGGTGIEVSMEVEFGVNLMKGKHIEWPRGEDAHHIFTVGNARPLDQALQHATTEMVRWLREDYGLDAHSAGILLGQTVEYAVGNVFDPAYTMVCKISKQVLGQIK
jgi:amidase